MASSHIDKHIHSILESDTHLRCNSTYFRNGNVSLRVTNFWNDTVATERKINVGKTIAYREMELLEQWFGQFLTKKANSRLVVCA